MTTLVEVIESGWGKEFDLTIEQASTLNASKIVAVTPTATGSWLVTGLGKVGVVDLGGVVVRVKPKLTIAKIFFLLGYGTTFEWRDDLVDYDSAPDLVHVLADAFAKQAERALGRGVIQGYVERDDSLAVVRGRLRYREQMTRQFGQISPLLVHYDDFTVDIAENQIIRAAARVLRSVPGVNSTVARKLRAVMSRLDDVSDLIPGQPIPVWRSTRRNAHYETVLWFAAIVLRHQSVDLVEGAVNINGFIINMATVFEDFLEVALSDSLRRIDGQVRAQDRQWLDVDGFVEMKPDLVWYRAGKPAAVIDAKYKIEKVQGYKNPDIYQMLAYCTALGLRVGHLVYAKGEEAEHGIVARESGVRVRAHALDLSAAPAQLLAQVDSLAQQICAEALVGTSV